jgi:hypothetical protein
MGWVAAEMVWPCTWRRRPRLQAYVGWLVRRSVGCHGTPKSTCRHEVRQIQLDAYVSTRGEPVKSDTGMMSLVR